MSGINIGSVGSSTRITNDSVDGTPVGNSTEDPLSKRQAKQQENLMEIETKVGEYDVHVTGSISSDTSRKTTALRNDEIVNVTPPREMDRTGLYFKRDLSRGQQRQKEIFSSGPPGVIVDKGGARDQLQGMFNKRLTDDEIRGLGGIPDSCKVEIKVWPMPDNTRPVTIRMKEGKKASFKKIDTIVQLNPEGKVNIHREETQTDPDAKPPGNLGGCVLVRQIHTARRLQANIVTSDSAGGLMNGYYTNARYGGDGRLLPSTRNDFASKAVQQKFENALRDPKMAFAAVKAYEDEWRNRKDASFSFDLNDEDEFVAEIGKLSTEELSVRELMETSAGRALWRVFGGTIRLTFHLADDSTTIQTLQKYGGDNCCFDLSEGFPK